VNASRLDAGDYLLPDGKSFFRYDPGALAERCTREMYDQLWNVSEKIPATPNPLNRNVNIKRKQATFGASYAFGAQLSARVDGASGILGAVYKATDESDWPDLVRLCVFDARTRVSDEKTYASAFAVKKVMVHVNWYPDGTAGMGRHSDAEPSLVRGAPIFSYSFHGFGAKSPPRLFDLYEKDRFKKDASKKNETPFASVHLSHGDACVMAGDFQRSYEHGVRSTAAKAHANHSRINVTVRAVVSERQE
jgi:alkylated DNA repair dioxygenase AlkB